MQLIRSPSDIKTKIACWCLQLDKNQMIDHGFICRYKHTTRSHQIRIAITTHSAIYMCVYFQDILPSSCAPSLPVPCCARISGYLNPLCSDDIACIFLPLKFIETCLQWGVFPSIHRMGQHEERNAGIDGDQGVVVWSECKWLSNLRHTNGSDVRSRILNTFYTRVFCYWEADTPLTALNSCLDWDLYLCPRQT